MLLVKNAKVYAPEYLGVKDILIAGGRIERIADHLPEYEGCEVIDGTGKIVTPGIIDRHVHVTGRYDGHVTSTSLVSPLLNFSVICF